MTIVKIRRKTKIEGTEAIETDAADHAQGLFRQIEDLQGLIDIVARLPANENLVPEDVEQMFQGEGHEVRGEKPGAEANHQKDPGPRVLTERKSKARLDHCHLEQIRKVKDQEVPMKNPGILSIAKNLKQMKKERKVRWIGDPKVHCLDHEIQLILGRVL